MTCIQLAIKILTYQPADLFLPHNSNHTIYQNEGQQQRPYGFVCVSLFFRPLPDWAVPPSFHAMLGNHERETSVSCYNASKSSITYVDPTGKSRKQSVREASSYYVPRLFSKPKVAFKRRSSPTANNSSSPSPSPSVRHRFEYSYSGNGN